MLFKEKFTHNAAYAGWTKTDHNSSPCGLGSGELKMGENFLKNESIALGLNH